MSDIISTESTLRFEIVKAIKSIARGDLGFNDDEKIFDYLKDYHPLEKEGQYLAAKTPEGKTLRAWGVQVLPKSEIIRAIGGIQYSRLYEVTIKGYYSFKGGADLNLLIDHARKVRGAIKNLGIRFNGAVDLIDDILPLDPNIEESVDGLIVVGTIIYSLRSERPDF